MPKRARQEDDDEKVEVPPFPHDRDEAIRQTKMYFSDKAELEQARKMIAKVVARKQALEANLLGFLQSIDKHTITVPEVGVIKREAVEKSQQPVNKKYIEQVAATVLGAQQAETLLTKIYVDRAKAKCDVLRARKVNKTASGVQ